jgi:hypothetical protein
MRFALYFFAPFAVKSFSPKVLLRNLCGFSQRALQLRSLPKARQRTKSRGNILVQKIRAANPAAPSLTTNLNS